MVMKDTCTLIYNKVYTGIFDYGELVVTGDSGLCWKSLCISVVCYSYAVYELLIGPSVATKFKTDLWRTACHLRPWFSLVLVHSCGVLLEQ